MVRESLIWKCLADNLAGECCGATFVDRAFLAWLEPKFLSVKFANQDITPGGHFILGPLPELLINRFRELKESFDKLQATQCSFLEHIKTLRTGIVRWKLLQDTKML